MVVLGLILLIVAVVAAVVLIVENPDAMVNVDAFGAHYNGVHLYWLAAAGAAILLVAVLGLTLMKAGSKRGMRKRRERKQLARDNARLVEQVDHNPAGYAATRRDDARANDASAPGASSYTPTPREQ